jgi:putative ABC transport system permease protein
MLKNYWIIAFRSLKKRWSYSLISVVGLSIALTAFTFIMLWVRNEQSYDRYNQKADRIYRIHSYVKQDPEDMDMAMTSPAAATALKNLPEVENAVRLSGPGKNVVVKSNRNLFNENDFYFADASVFQIFTFPLLKGNPKDALKEPCSIVLSSAIASKYFGSSNPIGKVLHIKYYDRENDYVVSGVMKNMPANSHFHANFFASLSTVEASDPKYSSEWGGVEVYTYALLFPNVSIDNFNRNISQLIKKSVPKSDGSWSLRAIPLIDIHLKSHRLFDIESNGNMTGIYIFGSIGILILIVALINFVSLSTTRYTERAKEVGVRKVLGASRKDLVIQFMWENIILILIALLASFIMIELSSPYFNTLISKPVSITFDDILWVVCIGLLISLLAVTYPAFFLASFRPVHIFGKSRIPNPGGNLLRNALIVLQFSITIILLICSLTINDQFRYILNKDLGINIGRTVFIPLRHSYLTNKYPIIKDEFMKLKGIKEVTASSTNPVNMNFMSDLEIYGKKVLDIKFMGVDYNFIKAMGLRIISGRDFSEEFATDSINTIIVNETAARKLKGLNLLGKEFNSYFDDSVEKKGLRIIGIVNDFNYRPLYFPVEPMVLYINNKCRNTMEIKLSSSNIPETISRLKHKWEQLIPEYPFDFIFPNENLQKEYGADNRMKDIFDVFSFISIFISCMGLFSLTSFNAEKRTKEIGIRKVLGSTTFQIVILLSKDFMKLIATSCVIAVPVAYYFMQKWLEQFSFRIKITYNLFIISILIVLAITFLIISYQALKVALANPIKSLKYE